MRGLEKLTQIGTWATNLKILAYLELHSARTAEY